MTLPLLDNPFSQRINGVIAKTRELRRGPYWPHLYLVREDGEPALRLWALSALIHDRADQAPSYQQYVNMLRDKVRALSTSGRHGRLI
jgi:protein transport protein SEC24